jgi:gluconolactonase
VAPPPSREVTLLTDELTRPNGIAFSPDEQTLYVANSDPPERAFWMAYDVQPDGSIDNGRVFFDATPLVQAGRRGAPDGLKVDQQGNLFATGPGGVLVIAPDGTHLGTIVTTQATANCAFGDDGSTLYITADMYLLRVPLTTKGMGF